MAQRSIMQRIRSAARAFTAPAPPRVLTFKSPGTPTASGAMGGVGGTGLQHFEGSETHRLNEARWARAGAADINSIISMELPVLRNRARYMSFNNPVAAGLADTYATHVVGPSGPSLQVESPNQEFADALEYEWQRFAEDPDASGQQDLAQMARMAIKQCFTDGEFLWQHYLNSDGVKVNDIDPSRLNHLATGPERGGDHVITGIERNRVGRPVAYHVQPYNQAVFGQVVQYGAATIIDAQYMIHGYQQQLPNQARGVPWFAPCLDDMEALREYEDAVLEAAKTAAKLSALLESQDIDAADVWDSMTTWEIQAGQAAAMPLGWRAKQMKPEHPIATYSEFVRERERRAGRIKGIPLMIIRLDAGDHNMASARFDAQIYQTHVRCDQNWLQNRGYRPLLQRVAQYVSLKQFNGVDIPFRARWTHAAIPVADALKEAMAERVRLENGSTDLADIIAANGKDPEAVFAARAREKARLQELGLPLGAYAGKIASEVEVSAILEVANEDSAPEPKKGKANAA